MAEPSLVSYTLHTARPQAGLRAKLSGKRLIVKNRPRGAGMRGDEINVTNHDSKVVELVRQRLDSLSPAERKLARVLLASYPIAGLESVARFAERAHVSPPTVTRFITKLGFRGYPEFQETLRHEVQARLSSPLTRYRHDQPAQGSNSALVDALDVASNNLKATLDVLSHRDVNESVELLPDVRHRVWVWGGR